MAINTTDHGTGESVYTQGAIETRAAMPLYQAVRELVGEYSRSGVVLDIGCSDGVATFGLDPGTIAVFGMDLNRNAVEKAEALSPGYIGVVKDMRNLPPNTFFEAAGVDTVLLLDVLEHERRPDSLGVLQALHSRLPVNHTLIVSMPIISLLSRCTWRELADAAWKRERPEMGLFDRTHRILTGMNGHLRLFAEAGYEPVEVFQTNDVEDITGNWKFRAATPLSRENDDLPPARARVHTKADAARLALRGVLHPSMAITALYEEAHKRNAPPRLQAATEKLVAYQGLYVLQPAQADVANA